MFDEKLVNKVLQKMIGRVIGHLAFDGQTRCFLQQLLEFIVSWLVSLCLFPINSQLFHLIPPFSFSSNQFTPEFSPKFERSWQKVLQIPSPSIAV